MRVSAAELRRVTERSLVGAGYPADEIPQIVEVLTYTMDVAETKAKASGVAIVGAHHSAPPGTGAVGFYAEKLAAVGFVAFGWSGSSELVVPYGGAEPRFGTNPVAVGSGTAHLRRSCVYV